MRQARPLIAGLVTSAALMLAASVPTSSAWTAATGSAGSSLAAAADWEAPAVSAAAVGKSGGGSTGFIRQGGAYYVFANVTDGGNPASGTSSATTGVGTISVGQTAVPLTAGSYSAQGVSYNRRSAALTADGVLAAGAYATSISTADAAANTAVVTGPSVTVDNSAPNGSDVQTTNGGAIAGRPDAGDTINLAWSNTLDPYSILSGWSGASTAAEVHITNGTPNDTVTITSTGAVTLPLGAIATNSNCVTTTATFAATMAQSGSTIVVTLGNLVSGVPRTDTRPSEMSWSTGLYSGATDRAGNALVNSAITESGTSDYDF